MPDQSIKVYIGGINGAGKSTVLGALKNKEIATIVIPGSSSFMRWLGVDGNNYLGLQAMDDSVLREEMSLMIQDLLAEDFASKPVFFDGHYIKIVNGQAEDWLGDWISNFDVLIALRGRTEDILKRIEADGASGARERNIFKSGMTDEDKIAALKEYQDFSIGVMVKWASLFSIPCFVVDNIACPEDTADSILKLINNI